jgi:hypothetical protein
MNKALYFPMFVNDYDEVQLTKLKRKFGIRGYGIYTFLRIKLQDIDNYEYPMTMIPDLAYMAGIPENEMTEIINDSGLFVIGNGYFSCPLLDEALSRHNGIKEKKSEQGKRGGLTRMSTLTPEERKALSLKGVEARKLKQQPAPQSAKILDVGYADSSQPANAGSQPDNEIEIDIENEIETEKEMETEKDKERDIDIERENFFSFSGIKLSKEVEDYLRSESKFFYGNNQNVCSRLYERYRVEQTDTKIASLKTFENVLYYHLLKITNTKNVQELNERLSKSSLSLATSDIFNTVQLISKKQEVNSDYKNEVSKVMQTKSGIDNSSTIKN